MADVPSYPGTPRWVKVFGIIATVLTLLVLFATLAGGGGPHGPGRHALSGDAVAHTGWGRLMLASSSFRVWRSIGAGLRTLVPSLRVRRNFPFPGGDPGDCAPPECRRP